MEEALISRLSALSHPHRMAVFRLLVRRCPDCLPAGEIANVLSLKASTTSVYLSALMRVGLLEQRRKGTSLLYSVDLKTAQSIVSDLFVDCCRGRPDLCPPAPVPHQQDSSGTGERKDNVLFICTGNSARSIFAEVILRDVAGDRFNAYSAGSRPFSELNPAAVSLLKDNGIDTSELRAKYISEFQSEDAPALDFVFTVCDRAANEECPTWPGQPVSAHWGQPDPVRAEGTPAQQHPVFQQAYETLRKRIAAFAALPLKSLDRISLQNRVDEIGKMLETK